MERPRVPADRHGRRRHRRPHPITRSIAEQAQAAIAEADLVLFVVDARAGITPGDEELAAILRRAHKPVFLLANKIDDPSRDADALEFHRLGLGDPIPLSALHGHGTGDLLDAIVAALPGQRRGRGRRGGDPRRHPRPAERRQVEPAEQAARRGAHDRLRGAGHDARLDRHRAASAASATFVLVDTAGLRRKRHQRQGIEYYSELRALAAAERADVALVLVDASEGVVEQDLAVADVARKAGCSTLVVLSKWDLSTVTIEDVRPRLESRLRQRPPLVAVSAKTGRGVQRVLDRVETLFDKHTARISTGELNRFLAGAPRGAAAAVEGRQAPQPALRHAGDRRGRRASGCSSTIPG